MTEAKECPFCLGSEIAVIGRPGLGFVVGCNHCGASSGAAPTAEKAIQKWNARERENAIEADYERMTDLLESAGQKLRAASLLMQAFTDIEKILGEARPKVAAAYNAKQPEDR